MLKETGFKYAVFSLDAPNCMHTISAMIRVLATVGVGVRACTGSYKGQVENSWVGPVEAVDYLVRHTALMANQESVLLVSECNKAYATLYYLATGRIEPLGSLCAVTEAEAKSYDAWTYRHDTKNWYVTKHENPDRVPPPQGWPSAARQAEVRKYIQTLDLATTTGHPALQADLQAVRRFLADQYGVTA